MHPYKGNLIRCISCKRDHGVPIRVIMGGEAGRQCTLHDNDSTGMGMGVSICRSIVEAHGGKLWATPATPYGTDFRFTIPPAETAAARAG